MVCKCSTPEGPFLQSPDATFCARCDQPLSVGPPRILLPKEYTNAAREDRLRRDTQHTRFIVQDPNIEPSSSRVADPWKRRA